MKKRVFVTDRQWDMHAKWMEKKYLRGQEKSLSYTTIMQRVRRCIVELLPEKGGMIVLEGWDEMMERAASGIVELVLIRGLPGSGKTTIAKEMYPEYVLVEADDWRETKDGYVYDPAENEKAHAWCRLEVERQLRLGNDVVVTGLYYRAEWVRQYQEIASRYRADFVVVEVTGKYDSDKGVPREDIERVKSSWEAWEGMG